MKNLFLILLSQSQGPTFMDLVGGCVVITILIAWARENLPKEILEEFSWDNLVLNFYLLLASFTSAIGIPLAIGMIWSMCTTKSVITERTEVIIFILSIVLPTFFCYLFLRQNKKIMKLKELRRKRRRKI